MTLLSRYSAAGMNFVQPLCKQHANKIYTSSTLALLILLLFNYSFKGKATLDILG